MSSNKHFLLVVDGSATVLFYIAMMLKRLEYTVMTATTAENALQKMRDITPALVITDTALPGMSGINFLTEMKRDSRLSNIPVIVHSAEIDQAVQEKCKAAGCKFFVNKPADPNALYQAIQAATESMPRHTIRIEVSLPVEIGDGGSWGGSARREEVSSLSDGGLYVNSRTPEAVKTVVPLTVFFPNRQVKAKAVVLYSSTVIKEQHKQPGMGLLFTSIGSEDKAFIQAFVKEKIAQGLSL